MTILKRKHREEVEDWEVSIESWKSRHFKCSTCRDEGQCQNCLRNGLNGCMDCGYQRDYCSACNRSRETCLKERGLA